MADKPIRLGHTTDHYQPEPEERLIHRRKVATDPVFVWEAVVKFTTSYDLPDNVDETAVIRAIANSKTAKVERLIVSTLGEDTPDAG